MREDVDNMQYRARIFKSWAAAVKTQPLLGDPKGFQFFGKLCLSAKGSSQW